MTVNYIYPLNAGVSSSETLNHLWATRWTAGNHVAFTSVSVNPTLKNPMIDSLGSKYQGSSANFFEIRKAPTDVGATTEPDISNHATNRIVNRIMPSSNPNTLANYATNKQNTLSHKIRCYDAKQTTTGQKVGGSSAPESGLDLENYDYFVLINPEISDDTSPTIRPHFAKINKLISYDEYGDGFEFSPKYPTTIPEGTNFEIYKGPAVTNTNIVAVSYGLRGDTAVNTTLDKYDGFCSVSLPTWYFYNDRLDIENQLDYDTKYLLTTCRWFKDWTKFATNTKAYNSAGTDTDWTANKTLTITDYTGDYDFATSDYGQSIWILDGSNYLHAGVIASHDNSNNTIVLDNMRTNLTHSQGTAEYIYYGRTITSAVFKTERKYGATIIDLGSKNQHGVLVDNLVTTDILDAPTDKDTNSTYTPNPSEWVNCFRNFSRNASDRTSAHASYNPTTTYKLIHGDLSGPRKYLYFKDSKDRNNGVTNIISPTNVNNPQNRISQFATVTSIDETGVKHLKMKEDADLKISTSLHRGSLSEHELPYTASTDTTSGQNIILQQIEEGFDARNDSFLSTGDIVRLENTYYRISAIASPLTDLKTQQITVDKKKLPTKNTWEAVGTLPNLSKKKIFVRAWNGGLTGSIPIDTEGVYSSNNLARLTINGKTISKENTALYNNKLVFLNKQFYGHNVLIDYGDAVNKYIKLQTPNKKFYVPSNNISFLYYMEGNYSIEDTVFQGTVEDISTKNEHGNMIYTVSGRDNISTLLNNSVNKNLNRTSDMVYSSLPPMLDFNDPLDGQYNLVSIQTNGVTITDTSDVLQALNKYDLVFHYAGGSDYRFMGEVSTATDNSGTTVIVFTHNNKTNPTSGNKQLKFVRLGKTSTYLSALKAAGANVQASAHPTELSHLGNNGISFNSGIKNLYNGASNTKTDLIYSSATGSYSEDESLGYDINSIKAIERGKDSSFAFKLAHETEAGVSLKPMQTTSGYSPYNVVSMNTKDEANSVISLAPTFPLVLGSIETNSSDTLLGSAGTTGMAGIYLVNTNLPAGGFLHRLSSELDSNYYFGDTIYRYTGLNKFKKGTVNETHTSVYNNNKNKQNIHGYCSAYKIDESGAIKAITASTAFGGGTNAEMGDLTHSLKPLRESNIWTGSHMGLTGGSSVRKAPTEWITEYESSNPANCNSYTGNWTELENIDYRTKTYDILGLGDMFIDSKLRHNNIAFAADSHEFTSFGLMLEEDGNKGDSVSHEKYTGDSNIMEQRDIDYDNMTIKSASISPSSMKRFGVMRLVEATFDWHFNPVDYESLPKTNALETISHLKWPRSRVLYHNLTVNYDNFGSINTGWLTLSGNVSLLAGDIIYRGKDGTALAVAHKTITNDSSLTVHNTDTTKDLKMLSYDDETDANGDTIYIVRTKLFNTLAPPEGKWGLDEVGNNGLYMPNMYMSIPMVYRDYLRHRLLVGTNSSTNKLNGHDLWIPLIGECIDGVGGTNFSAGDNRGQISGFHQAKDWTGNSSETYYHPSRIVNAITRQTFGSNSDGTQYKTHNNTHLYTSCNVLFRDMKKVTKQKDVNKAFTRPTSAVIDIDAGCINTWSNSLGTYLNTSAAWDDIDQHSRVLRINQKPPTGQEMTYLGTKTRSHFLGEDSVRSDSSNYDSRSHKHTENDWGLEKKGDVFQAQALFKPKIDFDSDTLNATSFSITLDENCINSWIDYVPNLKGYYLVSDKLVGTNLTLPDKDAFDGTTTTNRLKGEPVYIGKIIHHGVTDSSTYAVHTIKLDTTLNTANHGKTFRLMRISETTFKDTPDYFDLNKMFDTGLKYDYLTQNYITGDEELTDSVVGFGSSADTYTTSAATNDDLIYEEGLFAMYLLLDVDSIIDGKPDRRTVAHVRATPPFNSNTFTGGEFYITDGDTGEVKDLSIESSTTNVRITYDGELNGKGIVSFGEVFNVTTHVKPKIKDAKRAYIGTTFNVGTDAEKAMEDILEENDINVDTSEKGLVYTTNIVSQNTTGTTITLENNAINVSAGDDIYNQDGKFIGEVASTSTNTITLAELDSGGADVAYKPVANDEITVYNRKPLIVNSRFTEQDVYGAINFLANKKGLEYQFVQNSPGEMRIKDAYDYDSKRKFDISYKSGTVLEIEKNENMFDKATRVVVIGDSVKAEAEIPVTKGKTKTVKVIDPNITSVSEARIKAEKTLTAHKQKAKKIQIKMDRTGYEMMKPGDRVTLTFETHDIKNEEFTVFEIDNVMSNVTTVTVGTFNKTIAERLSELGVEQKTGFGTLFTKNAGETIKIHYEMEDVLLKETSLKYQVSTPGGTLSGWNTTIGHISTIGSGTDTVTTTEIKL